MKNRWVRIGVIVIAVLLMVLIVTPFFINANTFRPAVENELSTVLGRKVTIGSLSFSFFSGGLVADNVAIADDPHFSSQPFFQVKSLRIGVDMGPLIFHHQLNVRDFVAESPRISLIAGPNGTWNYSSLAGGNSTASSSSSGGPPASFRVGEVDIRNGQVSVSREGAASQPFTYSDVNLTVKNLSYTHAMPFTFSAKLPGDGVMNLTGNAGPVNRRNMAATPMRASLTVSHFDPVAAGAIPASDNISMLADIQAQMASDGRTLTSQGSITANDLHLSRNGSPAPQPVHLNYKVSEDLQSRMAQVQQLMLHTGQAAANITGTVGLAAPSATLNLNLSAPKLPIDQLESLLPALGVELPKGSQLKGGTLTSNLAITGTAASPVITGPVSIDNTQLAGFDLSQKILGLKALRSLGGGTRINTVRAQVQQTTLGTTLSNIYADVPQIGTASGNGTVSSAGALNFQLNAKLSPNSAVGSLVNGVATALGSVAGGFLRNTTQNQGIPISVMGTTSSPVIRANLRQMLTGAPGKPGSPGQPSAKKKAKTLLKGLFGR